MQAVAQRDAESPPKNERDGGSLVPQPTFSAADRCAGPFPPSDVGGILLADPKGRKEGKVKASEESTKVASGMRDKLPNNAQVYAEFE